jgi:site-specific DNA recombinase
MTKVVVYARVSSKEQEKEGFSIPAQLKLLEDYADRHDLSIVKTFTEAETAKKAGREAFNQMVAYISQSKDVKTILVEKTDRLYRNFKDYITIDDLDMEVHLVKENEVISKDSRSHSKFIHGIKVLMAKNYSDNLSEEVRKGMKEKAEQGHFPHLAPYGYRNNRETRMIDIDPATAPFVRRAFQLYGTGEYSLAAVAKQLKAEGFVFKSYKTRIDKGTLESLLKNVFYTGDFMIKGKFYKGKHEPLVSLPEFQAVQNAFTKVNRPKLTKHDFAFAGLMTCGHCGSSVTGQIQRGKYIYYHCSGGKGHCHEPYHREEKIADWFAEEVKKIQLDQQDLEWMLAALKESHKDEMDFHKERIGQLQERFNRLTNRIEAIYEDKLDGKIPEELWLRKHEEYKRELGDVEISIAQHTKGNLDYVECGVQLLELAKNAYPLYIQQTPLEQRRLLHFLLLNTVLNDGKLTVTWKKPFDWIANRGNSQEWWAIGDLNTGPHPYQGCALAN